MLELYFVVVFMCVVSTVMCGPMPQPSWIDDDDEEQYQSQNERAIDRFSTKLVGNRRIRENYLDCFLDNGPCSPEASNIKRMIPEAIQKECDHCTELQKKVIEKMMCYLNNHQPDILQQVAAKFDPNGEYMKQYINTIEKNQNQPSFRPQLNQPQQPRNPPQQHQHPQQQPQNPPQQHQPSPQQPQHPPQNQHPQQGNECETCDQNYQPQQPQRPPQQHQPSPQQPQHPSQNQHPQQGNECETCDQNDQFQQAQRPPQQHQHSPQQPQHSPQQHRPNQFQPQNQHSPQQPQFQYTPLQNDCETCEQNQGHQYQHQHQQQHQQQYQHEQQLKTTVVTSSPISTGAYKH